MCVCVCVCVCVCACLPACLPVFARARARERERERERQTERERERQRDRQTDRQTDRDRQKQIDCRICIFFLSTGVSPVTQPDPCRQNTAAVMFSKQPTHCRLYDNSTTVTTVTTADVLTVVAAVTQSLLLNGATPGLRKQASAGQDLTNISVTPENGESWEGRCAGVSHSAK